MSALAATHPPADNLRGPLFVAVLLHALLGIGLVISGYFGGHENLWGGPGGSVTVGVVGSLPAIPLPQPEVQTPNRVVDDSKGLYQPEPKAKPLPPPPDATPIPKFDKKNPPKIISRPSRVLDTPPPPPPNAIPYGGGGAPSIPRSSFTMGQTNATQGGLSFNGIAGGDFGSRFSYYVTAVQQRISSNWLQSTIDPGIPWAPRLVVTFDILRNGTVANIQITQSSNNASVDTSARRAIEQSNPLPQLPSGYPGSKVSVEFYFDYKKQ